MEKEELNNYIKAIDVWNAEIEEYTNKIASATKSRSELIKKLKGEIGTKFEHDGKWYLIKEREKSQTCYLSVFNVSPGSWRKKKEENEE